MEVAHFNSNNFNSTDGMYIALSPAYAVRNEAFASFLIRVNKIIGSKGTDFDIFNIPPFMGYILSHLGDAEYPVSVEAISSALDVSFEAVDKFVGQLIGNESSKEFKLSDTVSIVLPTGLLSQYERQPESNVYEEASFDGSGDMSVRRSNVPVNANFMITTKCNTDCIYCYANRKISPDLKTDKILDLIKELHDQGTINITLTGGDIFAHPDWQIILKCARDYGYKPFLSTKTPLNFEQVKYLRDLGYEEIQFSLDSADPDDLKRLIKVREGYLDQVSSFFRYCSELNLDVLVRSVLTKINASKEKITSLYEFISSFECIKEWAMTPAFFSKYKEAEYKLLEVSNDDLVWIYEFSQRDNLAFKVKLNKISDKGYVLKKFKTTEEYVCYNQICMANTSCISILANGNCSVCEMLYDNPEYILGNVNESSVREIWNSEKALNLYTMSRQQFPESSPCKTCESFEKCRNDFGKRVCYIDIFKSGESKWFPDPRCPHAEEIDVIL